MRDARFGIRGSGISDEGFAPPFAEMARARDGISVACTDCGTTEVSRGVAAQSEQAVSHQPGADRRRSPFLADVRLKAETTRPPARSRCDDRVAIQCRP